MGWSKLGPDPKLAARIGVTPTHMSRLETGKRDNTLTCLRRIAKELGVATVALLAPDDVGFVPSERELRLLKALRSGGELAMRTVEAVADILSSSPASPHQ